MPRLDAEISIRPDLVSPESWRQMFAFFEGDPEFDAGELNVCIEFNMTGHPEDWRIADLTWCDRPIPTAFSGIVRELIEFQHSDWLEDNRADILGYVWTGHHPYDDGRWRTAR